MSWIKHAKVGDRVVCVDAEQYRPGLNETLPISGEVYTISWIGHYKWTSVSGIGIRLSELDRFHPFGAYRFRPVQSRPTDISIFERLLSSTPADLVEETA